VFGRVPHLNDSPSVLQSSHSEGESCLDSASVLSTNTLAYIGSSDRCECSVKGPKPASTLLKPVNVMFKPLTRVAIDIIGHVPCDVSLVIDFLLCMFDRVVNIEYRYRHRYYRRYFRRIDIDIDDTFMSKYRKRYRRYFWGRFVRYFDIDTFELI